MTVDAFCLGALDTNAYLVTDETTRDGWLFDAPDHPGALLDAVQERGITLRALYLTHAHVDHMAGVSDVREAWPGLPVYQHTLEAAWLADPSLNLSTVLGAPVTCSPAEGLLHDGQVLTVGPWTVHVLHVPGHSPGSVAYYWPHQGELISGDVLFRSGVGRWDFPGCDLKALQASVARLCALPDDTRVRPGHGGSTTVAREKSSNPYVRHPEAWE